MEGLAVSRPAHAEVAARRRTLAGRPAELRRLEQELALNAVLDARPGAPRAASNFAARVLLRIESEDRAARPTSTRPHRSGWWYLLGLRPAMAMAVLALIGFSLGWRALSLHHRSQMAASVATVVLTTTAPGLSAESLENYEIIRRLGTAAQPGDDDLIAALAENVTP